MSNERPDQGVARSFAAFLQMVGYGAFHGEATEALNKLTEELTNHINSTGRTAKGTLTLKFDITMKEPGLAEIHPDIKVKAPEAPRGRTILWTTPENNFSQSNPRQLSMFAGPRTVIDNETGEVRSV